MKNFKKLLLLAAFGLFAAQTPLLQASEENKQNSFVDTAPARIMKWSGAIACVALAAASIYYMPKILSNLHTATDKINNQTVTAWTQAGIAIEKDTGSIVKIVDDFNSWLKSLLKDPLTFNIGIKESTLHKFSEAALRDLPPHTGF